MAVDVTKLSDNELAALPGQIKSEVTSRGNKKGFPVAKKAVDDKLTASFSKTKAAVKTEADTVDGEYMVVDVGDNDALMKALLDDGGIYKAKGKVRIHAARAVRDGGALEKLEALL